jgi:hypothetical protein
MFRDHYEGVCWWCIHKADEYVGCPVKLRVSPNRKHREMLCTGYFCSFQCALAWGLQNDHENSRPLTYLLARRNYDCDGQVTAAPTRERLKMFGGAMSIEQFRSASNTDTLPKKRKQARYVTVHNSKTKHTVTKVGNQFALNSIK